MTGAFARVPELAAQHLLLAMAALALGIAIAVPLGFWSAHRPAAARVALGFASLVQTIPSLALLALFYPVLLWIGGVPALGFLPSLLALTLYALLPILRNVVTGLQGLNPAVIEAADGIGMTRWQKRRLVEAPLVLPVVMAGIRTAAVWTIGAATLSTTVGQPSLGDLIFAGLQTQSWPLVLAGCIAAAALALAVDALLGLAEHGLRTRRRWLAWVALGIIAAATFAASAPLWRSGGSDRVVVGAKNFSEQYILARLIGDRLRAAGYEVEYRDGLGSAVAFGAVASGAIDVYVDYAGTIWTNQMERTDVPARPAQVRAIADWTKRTHDVSLLGTLGFENAYAFAMREGEANRLGIATLDDLAARSPQLRLGSDLEFLERPEWAAVRRAYPMRFAEATPYSPTFMYRALASGRADVISAFSSDGRIAADKLRVLADPKQAIPGYDAILLVAPKRADDARFTGALRPLLGAISVENMREANYMVDRDSDKATPEAAADWLAQRIGR
ncbi:ABC transporter permease/substrate-binding protein [Sphingomonas dokdonensis]|uniref:Glycine betaine/carnitine/choline transport system permease protein OpuCB n=1 Tax=Sphingomonas dokdonensis TaxID=344880 RepID=A0A245ZGL2_9SPHN|nr:ABC transporter permease/substrate-binding protein [Sphingomonas dokdonensis]OWK28873.1 glycine betaine/carnitine/choline transport system permease protein OpuCB [Sphingomonas dokdonensis]